MKCLLSMIFLFACSSAVSAENIQILEPPSLMGSLVQMFSALAIVIGMILLFYYAANKFLKNGLPVAGQQSKYIRIIETRYLAPKKSLHLIEVGGEYLLLSNSGENLQYIKQVDMLEEIEVLGSESMTKKMSGNIQAKIIDLVSRLPKRDIPFDDLKTTGSQRP